MSSDKQHLDTKPCEKCGSGAHGTGAHEKIVKLELETIERAVQELLEGDLLARLELAELTLSGEWELGGLLTEPKELVRRHAELLARCERLGRAIRGELFTTG